MAKTVKHKKVYRNIFFPCETLCNTVSNVESNYNDSDDVTCKKCLKIMANPKHWRNRQITEEKP
jgi:hypothetical protein